MRRLLIAAVMLAAVGANGQDPNWYTDIGTGICSVWRWTTQSGTNFYDAVSNRHGTLDATTLWTSRSAAAYSIAPIGNTNHAVAIDTFGPVYALPVAANESGSWGVGMWVNITNNVNTVLYCAGSGNDHWGDEGHSFILSWEYSLKRIRMTVRTAASNNTSVLSPNSSCDFAGNGWQFVGFGYNRSPPKYDMWINADNVRSQLSMGSTHWNTNGTPTISFGQRAIPAPYDTAPAAIGDAFFVVGRWLKTEDWTNLYWRSSTNYVAPSPPAASGTRFSTVRAIYNLTTRGHP